MVNALGRSAAAVLLALVVPAVGWSPLAPTAALGATDARAAAAATAPAGSVVRLAVVPARTVTIPARSTRNYTPPGVPGAGVAGVLLDVTVNKPAAAGSLLAYGAGLPRPTVGLALVVGQKVSRNVLARLGAENVIVLGNVSAKPVTVQVAPAGYVRAGSPTVAGGLRPVAPVRLYDSGTRGIPAKGYRDVRVAGRGGVPASGASAAFLNVRAVAPARAGVLTVYPAGTARPARSSLHFARSTIDDLAFSTLGGGKVRVHNASSRPVRVQVDLNGYLVAGSPTAAGSVKAVGGARLPTQSVPANGSRAVAVAGRAGVPARGATAVLLNLKALSPTRAGQLVPGPALVPGVTRSQQVLAPLDAQGRVVLTNRSGAAVRVVPDVVAFLVGAVVAPVTDFTATATGSSVVELAWSLPVPLGSYAGVTIRRSTGTTAPGGPAAGTAVAETSGPGATFLDTGVSPGTTYTYAAFARDAAGNVAPAATASATTTATAWKLQVLPFDRESGSDIDLDSAVQCVSTTRCVSLAHTAGYGGVGFWAMNGTTWSLDQVVTATRFSSSNGLGSLSCVSATSCRAVGLHQELSGTLTLRTATGGPGAWTLGSTSLPADPLRPPMSLVKAFQCFDVQHCTMLVSFEQDDAAALVAYTLADGTWTGTQITGVGPDDFSSLNLDDFACPSTTSCVAVGTASDLPIALVRTGASWAVQRPALPAGGTAGRLSTVSWAAAGQCAAVGTWADTDGPQHLLMRLTLSAGTWTAAALPSPPVGVSLWRLSCFSATACYAADEHGMRRLSGSTWSYIPYDPTESSGFQNPRAEVRCFSPASCVAVGSYSNSTRFKSFSATYDGTSWSVTKVPSPTRAARANSVSCATPTNCLTSGNYADDQDAGRVFSRVLSGTGPVASDPAAPFPDPHPPEYPQQYSFLTAQATACPTSSRCTVVGNVHPNDVDISSYPAGYATEKVDGAWSTVALPSPATGDRINGAGTVDDLSCVGPEFCMAVGWYPADPPNTGDKTPLVTVRSAAGWTNLPGPSLQGLRHGVLTSVSCASATWCVALGRYTDAEGTRYLVNATWANGTWTSSIEQATLPGELALDALSCPTVGRCTAVGAYTEPGSPVLMIALQLDGGVWTLTELPDTTSAQREPLAVSCRSASDCTVVTTHVENGREVPEIFTQAGGTWSAELLSVPGGWDGRLAGVSCTGSTGCTAVGSADQPLGMFPLVISRP